MRAAVAEWSATGEVGWLPLLGGQGLVPVCPESRSGLVIAYVEEFYTRLEDAAELVIMPAGSGVFCIGTLWHGGGANHSVRDCLAGTAQYCEPWLRPRRPMRCRSRATLPVTFPQISGGCSATASTRHSWVR